MTERRRMRDVTEREIAMTILLTMADHDRDHFALLGFYDDDADFLKDVADTLNVAMDKSFDAKLKKVVRNLVDWRVFSARMRGTHKEYMGEPSKQMEYTLKPGKLGLLRSGKTAYTMDPEGEAAFILRHAYPEPETE